PLQILNAVHQPPLELVHEAPELFRGRRESRSRRGRFRLGFCHSSLLSLSLERSLLLTSHFFLLTSHLSLLTAVQALSSLFKKYERQAMSTNSGVSRGATSRNLARSQMWPMISRGWLARGGISIAW